MPEYTQANRLIQIFTPLGEDVLLLHRVHGNEGISQLFQFELKMFSENRSLSFESIVGKNATVKVLLPDQTERYINGIINAFTQGGSMPFDDQQPPKIFATYRATLVPWFWFLTQTTDSRIFQNLSVPEILEKIFNEYGFTDFVNRLQGNFEPREYCVQYRETSFAFLSRLMEEEGIFYFFEHQKDKHILVLANHPNEFKPGPHLSTISYETLMGQERIDDVIHEWDAQMSVRPGKVTLSDFNFEMPTVDLTTNIDGQDSRRLELYDYPGEYKTKSEGERLAGIRLQEAEVQRSVTTAVSTCRGLLPGYRFRLQDHYRRDFNREYAVTTVYHEADQGMNFRSSGGDADAALKYHNRFQCIPHPTHFRPARNTPTPVVQGSQTAIVVGPSGEEIYVDKYGRVKVQFHWDRHGQYNEKSSCWVRVSQNWAGKRWGAVFLPRIGQEVIIDFLEGDPNQPIITGRVYNAGAMPPYALPDEMTKSTVKSNSSKGGGGFNELRFEDKKGKEQIFINAEKDHDFRIKNDRKELVGNESHLIIKKDQTESVGGDKHLTVKGAQNEKVDGTVSLKAGRDLQRKVGMKYALDAGMEIHLKSGTNLVLESGTTLTLKVGGNFININPGGVFIQGTMVMINSGGAAGAGAGASPQPPNTPKEADKADPGERIELPPKKAPPRPTKYSPMALVLKEAAQDGTPFCDI
ncbi:MAG TPA: type VI secretion system tip protein VgrG [Blastocatellia bacterium]|nr:type VI secretion system tip protein VgrG [Blastocatellia bacterium]